MSSLDQKKFLWTNSPTVAVLVVSTLKRKEENGAQGRAIAI
jgi:hypothetical protein